METNAGGTTFIGSATLPCEDANPALTFDNGDARYKAKPLVQVQP